MPKLVKQTVTLPAPAKDLYAMYLNPRMHKAITGGKVVISARPGSKFSAFGGTGSMGSDPLKSRPLKKYQ